jgi:hypothetical protein
MVSLKTECPEQLHKRQRETFDVELRCFGESSTEDFALSFVMQRAAMSITLRSRAILAASMQ